MARRYSQKIGWGLTGITKMGDWLDDIWREIDGTPYGQVFYQDPVNGLDTNDGLTPTGAGGKGPLLTLQAAIDLCTAEKGDTIKVAKGSHSVTAPVEFNKRGIVVEAMMGMAGPAMGERFTVSANASLTDEPVAIITEPCVIKGLGFAGRDLTKESLLFDCDEIGGWNAGFSALINCRFSCWYGAIATGIRMKGGQLNHIMGCTFDGLFVGFGTAAIITEKSGYIDPGFIRVLGNYFSGVGSGKHCIKHSDAAIGVVYAHNYIDGGYLGNRGKFLDNNNKASEGLAADNWLGGLANQAAAFENLTNSSLKFAGNHYEEA